MAPDRAARAQRIAARYLADPSITLEGCGRAEDPPVSAHTAMRDLERLGIARRRPEPAPGPRKCARDECKNIFRPTRRQLELGFGKYCSNACDGMARRIYPKPEERECARLDCDEVFTPRDGWAVANGKGLYCSQSCAALAQRRPSREKGQWVTCELWRVSRSRAIRRTIIKKYRAGLPPELREGSEPLFAEAPVLDGCKQRVWRWACELERDRKGKSGEREGWFCSRECHAEYRRLYEWPGLEEFLSPLASGKARHQVLAARKGRRNRNKNGAEPGRKRRYSDEAAAHVRRVKTAHPDWGRDSIARVVPGVSSKQARNILREG